MRSKKNRESLQNTNGCAQKDIEPPKEANYSAQAWNGRSSAPRPPGSQATPNGSAFNLNGIRGALNESQISSTANPRTKPGPKNEQSGDPPPQTGANNGHRKRSAGEAAGGGSGTSSSAGGSFEDYETARKKRLRFAPLVTHDPGVAQLPSSPSRTLMIVTDKMPQRTWQDANGPAFQQEIQKGVRGAMKPESYVVVTRSNDPGASAGDEGLWANRDAGNMMHTLRDRIDRLNEQLDLVRETAIISEQAAQRRLEEERRQHDQKLEKADRDGAEFRRFFRHIRYRSMIQFALNRGYLHPGARVESWGGRPALLARQRAISSVVHTADLKRDIELISSNYLEEEVESGALRNFYVDMFGRVYGIKVRVAKWIVHMAKKSATVSCWINLIDRYLWVVDCTLSTHLARGSRRPDPKAPAVKRIFEELDDAYRTWIRSIEILQVAYKKSADRDLATLKEMEDARIAAGEFHRKASEMEYWNKGEDDDRWEPAARLQMRYNSDYFIKRFQPEETDDEKGD